MISIDRELDMNDEIGDDETFDLDETHVGNMLNTHYNRDSDDLGFYQDVNNARDEIPVLSEDEEPEEDFVGFDEEEFFDSPYALLPGLEA
jgi:hypothetical protein